MESIRPSSNPSRQNRYSGQSLAKLKWVEKQKSELLWYEASTILRSHLRERKETVPRRSLHPQIQLYLLYNAKVLDFAARNRFPAMYDNGEFVGAGGLMNYAANSVDLFRRAAEFVDKILKGAKPPDLPVEQPKKFDFIVNLKTAKQIGVTIPPEVLARANKVIK